MHGAYLICFLINDDHHVMLVPSYFLILFLLMYLVILTLFIHLKKTLARPLENYMLIVISIGPDDPFVPSICFLVSACRFHFGWLVGVV